jgi:hypothetical protein
MLFAGCRSPLVPYVPTAGESPEEAKLIVTEVVERQPRAFAPTYVEVTDLKLVVDWQKRRTVIYFERMTSAEIFKDRRGSYYVVLIRDEGARTVCRVWTPELLEAQRLVDSLHVLQRHARDYDPEAAAERRRSEERLRRLRRIQDEIEEVRQEQQEERQRRELELEVENPEAPE